jgi:hypothetical protein
MFHNVAINQAPKAQKSLTPQSLKKKANSSNHNLDGIKLDHVSKLLLASRKFDSNSHLPCTDFNSKKNPGSLLQLGTLLDEL